MAEGQGKEQGPISRCVDNLEQMFQKADNEINHLTQKLAFQIEYGDGDTQVNPVKLMSQVEEVKKEYSSLTKDLQDIQVAQKETVDYLRQQLLTMTEMMQRLSIQTGSPTELTPSEKEMFSNLAQVMGIPAQDLLPPPPNGTQNPTLSNAHDEGTGNVTAQSKGNTELSMPQETIETQKEEEPSRPSLSPAEIRAGSSEFIPLSQEEFLSVSELVRLRAKLDDVNRTYERLWQHFKEEGNTEPITTKEMMAKGLKVIGATGEAKLKILRSLKLCTIQTSGSVNLT